ncbi:serine/threonine-protein kinase [Actinomadura flavalba]|uniref:serine/threonine-protein kinase n=1 Tax=Actinomadura flavalba TaxID=1120938 RepID=UPI000683E43B|nr:serine/threonine-protein kinase [Actinomadura flavalba]
MVNGWTVPGFTHATDLGGGTAGRVVLAVDDLTQTKVAIKYLDSRLDSDEVFLSRFRMTARRLSQIEDPNVVDLFDLVESPQGTAVVMERVDGVTLRRILAAQGPTGPLAALSAFGGVLLGLAAAHDADVAHGALRPANVLVDASGNARLTDFGMAPSGDAAQGGPAYAAPELWGGAPPSAPADLYAATAVFFECLTGSPPFTGRSLAKAHREAPVPVESVPGPLRDLIAQGLAKEPEKRPASAADFLEAVETAAVAAYGPSWEAQGRERLTELARQAAEAPEPPPAKAAKAASRGAAAAPAKRSRTKPLVAAAATIVIVGGVAGAAIAMRGGEDTPPATPATSGSPSPVPTVDPALAQASALADKVEAAVDRPAGAAFTFRRSGCCGTANANGSLALQADAPASYQMTVQGSGGTRKAGRSVLLKDTTWLRAGGRWRSVDFDPRARGYAGLAAQIREGSAVANVPALLRNSATFTANGGAHQGTAPLDRLAQVANVGDLFGDLAKRTGATEVTYTVHLDKQSRPTRVTFRAAGPERNQTYTSTYSRWGAKVSIGAPR